MEGPQAQGGSHPECRQPNQHQTTGNKFRDAGRSDIVIAASVAVLDRTRVSESVAPGPAGDKEDEKR